MSKKSTSTVVGGKVYHFVKGENGMATMVPGPDPADPGTCPAILTVLGNFSGKCIHDAGHDDPVDDLLVTSDGKQTTRQQHETAKGLKWPHR